MPVGPWASSASSGAFSYDGYLTNILSDPDAPKDLRQQVLNELRQREETGRTVRWLAAVILVSLLLVFIGQGCLISHERARHRAAVESTSRPASRATTTSETAAAATGPATKAGTETAVSEEATETGNAGGYGSMLTASLWAIGWLSGGALIGFLFGIPRIIQPEDVVRTDANTTNAVAPASPAYRQRVNTNLEQISDWLTKIIVGLGLIELRRLPGFLHRAADYMTWTGCAVTCPPFAAAIIVTFSILGFFTGYLVTRMFLASAFGRADRAADSTVLAAAQKIVVRTEAPAIDGGAPASAATAVDDDSPAARAAAREVIRRFESSPPRSIDELRALAKAQLIDERYQDAVESYGKLASSTQDPAVHYEFAVALAQVVGANADSTWVELNEAKKYVHRADAKLRERIYNALIFVSLYRKNGFLEAIKVGEEFLSTHKGDGQTYVNLACAYAQAYDAATDPNEKRRLKDKVVECVNRAKAAGAWYHQRLILLADPSAAKGPGMDDLEKVAAAEKDVRDALEWQP